MHSTDAVTTLAITFWKTILHLYLASSHLFSRRLSTFHLTFSSACVRLGQRHQGRCRGGVQGQRLGKQANRALFDTLNQTIVVPPLQKKTSLSSRKTSALIVLAANRFEAIFLCACACACAWCACAWCVCVCLMYVVCVCAWCVCAWCVCARVVCVCVCVRGVCACVALFPQARLR